VLPLLIGCGPKTVIVTGKVTFLGEPGKDISVTFQPTNAGATSLPAAMGMTDDNGMYRLRLAGEKKKTGAMPGEYAVFFTWMDPNADPNPEAVGYKPNPCPYQIPDKALMGRVQFTVPEKGPVTANFDFTEEDMKEKIKQGI
jgi:hypothetical protein